MADDPKHKYVNFAKVVFTPNEFFCDFITLYPLVEDKPAPPGELLQVRGDVVGRLVDIIDSLSSSPVGAR